MFQRGQLGHGYVVMPEHREILYVGMLLQINLFIKYWNSSPLVRQQITKFVL
jgi:hypothetical protein